MSIFPKRPRESETPSKRGLQLSALALLCLAFGATAASLIQQTSWTSVATPMLLLAAGILFVRLLYFWNRTASYERRERRRTQNPAVSLVIPTDVKKVEQYEGGQPLHDAQWTYIGRAAEAQGQYFATGILAAVLPPIALVLLSLQLLAVPEGGSWALGLILSEILCLGIRVYFALTDREPTAEWIVNRVRTELFRREQYLLLAGVGPYLGRDALKAHEEALRRRSQG